MSQALYTLPAGTRTRRVRCASAINHGRFKHWGARAVFRTNEGVSLVGVLVQDRRRGGSLPVIEFPDGSWGRADNVVRLVVEA